MLLDTRSITTYSKKLPVTSDHVKRAKFAYYRYERTFGYYLMISGEGLADKSFMFRFFFSFLLAAIFHLPHLVIIVSRQIL
jgi:hypothetical protein